MTVWYAYLHARRSSTRSDINQMSHWYNNSPDEGHMAARNMKRIEINIRVKLFKKLLIYKDHNRMHIQQNIEIHEYGKNGLIFSVK